MNMENILDMSKALEERFGKKVLGLGEVTEYLGLDESSIRGLVESGSLKAMKSEGQLLFKAIQVIKFEYDIDDDVPTMVNNFVTPEKESAEMTVSKGSIYETGSKKNPLEMAFNVRFDDDTSQRYKIRGKNKAELEVLKAVKVAEELEKHKKKNSGGEAETEEVEEEVEEAENNQRLFREVADEWFIEFEADQRSQGNSYSNIKSVGESIAAIKKVVGDMDISEITTTTGNNMMTELSRDKETGAWRSKSYGTKLIRNFKRVMDYALTKGYTKNVIGKINLNKNLTEPSKNDRFLSEECLCDLLKVVEEHPRFRALINIILASGMRQSEALAISIDDLRQSGEFYNVYVSKADIEVEKNVYEIVNRLKDDEEPREVSIDKGTYDMVREYYYETMKDKECARLKREAGNEKLVFTNKYGKVINKKTLYRSFVIYLNKKFGNEDKVRLHMLRHCFASLMCDEIPIELVSEMLGHREVSTTMKFYKSITNSQKKMISNASTNMMNKFRKDDKIAG